MTFYTTHLKDIMSNNYLGIDIPQNLIEKYLNELKDMIGDDDYIKYTDLQKAKDEGRYHITLINTIDYNKLSKKMGIDIFVNSLDSIFKYPIDDIKMLGVGTATKNENRAYFIVCKSDKLDAIRNRYGLPEKDIHITIGFLHKDVHDVRKNVVMSKYNKFLKLLSQEFYKNDNCNFIRDIRNYDLDTRAEIIIIEINETSLKVKCDGYYLLIVFMEDGEEFRIVNKYPIDIDLPRLPETEIAKILKK